MLSHITYKEHSVASELVFLRQSSIQETFVRNKIFGGVGVVWGALILYNGLSR